MPKQISVDTFLRNSIRLLQARPTTTHVSITYGTIKRSENKITASTNESKDKNEKSGYFNIKTYDPVSGLCYTIRLRKHKEVSRVLSGLGPHQVQFSKKVEKPLNKKATKTGENKTEGNEAKDTKKKNVEYETVVTSELGMSAIMANVVIPVSESSPSITNLAPSTPTTKTTTQPQTGKTGGKKNKKKNKK